MKTHLGKEQKKTDFKKEKQRPCSRSAISSILSRQLNIPKCPWRNPCKNYSVLQNEDWVQRETNFGQVDIKASKCWLVLSLDKGGAMVSQMLVGGEWRRVEESG